MHSYEPYKTVENHVKKRRKIKRYPETFGAGRTVIFWHTIHIDMDVKEQNQTKFKTNATQAIIPIQYTLHTIHYTQWFDCTTLY